MLPVGGHVRRAPLFGLYGQVPSAGRGQVAAEITKLLGRVIVIVRATAVVAVVVDTVRDAVSVAARSLEGPLPIRVHHLPDTMRMRNYVKLYSV